MGLISVVILVCASLNFIQAENQVYQDERYRGMLTKFQLPLTNGQYDEVLTKAMKELDRVKGRGKARLSLGSFGSSISKLVDSAKNMTSDIYNSAKDKTSDIYNSAKNKTSDVYNSAKDKTSDIYNSAKDKTSDIYNSAKDKAGQYVKDIKDKISSWTGEMMRQAANMGGGILLAEFKLILKLLGIGGELALPDILTSSYGFTLNATGGYFRSLSSLERDGDVNVTMEKFNSIQFDIPVKLDEMNIVFNHFEVKAFSFFATSGSFSIKCNKTNIVIKLRITLATSCVVDVEKVVINKFEGIDVKFNGVADVINNFIDKLTNTAVDYLNKDVRNQLETTINTNLQKAIKNKPMICTTFIPS